MFTSLHKFSELYSIIEVRICVMLLLMSAYVVIHMVIVLYMPFGFSVLSHDTDTICFIDHCHLQHCLFYVRLHNIQLQAPAIKN